MKSRVPYDMILWQLYLILMLDNVRTVAWVFLIIPPLLCLLWISAQPNPNNQKNKHILVSTILLAELAFALIITFTPTTKQAVMIKFGPRDGAKIMEQYDIGRCR